MKKRVWVYTALILLTVAVSIFTQSSVFADNVKFEHVFKKSGMSFKHEKATFHKDIINIMPWLTAGGSGVAIGDYNNDGRDDVYFISSKLEAKNHLYRNDGNFNFTDVAGHVGLADVNKTKKTGTSSFALWVDVNNDGWQDLFLLRFGKIALFENQQGKKFIEITKKAGVYRHTNALSAASFDYDKDGDLDIYVGGYFPEKDFHNPVDSKVLFDSWETARNGGRNYLFRNNNDGTFTDVTDEAGLHDSGWAMAIGHGDFNNDGWQDIYIANDFGTDILFKNLGNGRFADISNKSIGVDTKKGMNAEVGDYNNDGLLDIYVTNMTEPYLHECNMLWRNNGDETFTDVSEETNSCDTKWGWGAKFVDVDNDGYQDLYVANGFISDGEKDYMDILLDFIFKENIDLRDAKQWPKMEGYSMAGYERNVMFIQTKKGFKSIEKEAGVDSIKDSRGVAVADFDNDGRMDIVVSNVQSEPDVYRNVSKTTTNWIQLRLEGHGKKSNRSAIGARVTARIGKLSQLKEVAGGNGFDAQSSMRLHFGLGDAKKVDLIKVVWPDGMEQEFKNVKANTIYKLKQQGSLIDSSANHVVSADKL